MIVPQSLYRQWHRLFRDDNHRAIAVSIRIMVAARGVGPTRITYFIHARREAADTLGYAPAGQHTHPIEIRLASIGTCVTPTPSNIHHCIRNRQLIGIVNRDPDLRLPLVPAAQGETIQVTHMQVGAAS